jgi:hypothetical protein
MGVACFEMASGLIQPVPAGLACLTPNGLFEFCSCLINGFLNRRVIRGTFLNRKRWSSIMRKNSRWTAEHERSLLELKAAGKSSRQMAGALRRSPPAVEQRLYILRDRDLERFLTAP